MTKLVNRILIVAVMCFTCTLGVAAEGRDLYDNEVASLVDTAGKLDHLDVLHVDGSVTRSGGRQVAHAAVVYNMEQPSPYCMAPTIYFRAEGNQNKLDKWEPVENIFRYRFWYLPCDVADPKHGIELDGPMSIPLLETIRAEEGKIIRDALDRLSPTSQTAFSHANLVLRRIGTSHDDSNRRIFEFRFQKSVSEVLDVRTVFDGVLNHFMVIDSSLDQKN